MIVSSQNTGHNHCDIAKEHLTLKVPSILSESGGGGDDMMMRACVEGKGD